MPVAQVNLTILADASKPCGEMLAKERGANIPDFRRLVNELRGEPGAKVFIHSKLELPWSYLHRVDDQSDPTLGDSWKRPAYIIAVDETTGKLYWTELECWNAPCIDMGYIPTKTLDHELDGMMPDGWKGE